LAGAWPRRVGRKLYRGLFTIMGPAQVGRYEPRRPGEGRPDGGSAVLPPGYHVETYVDPSGVRRRIATPDKPSS
jgi:hypothetical protein